MRLLSIARAAIASGAGGLCTLPDRQAFLLGPLSCLRAGAIFQQISLALTAITAIRETVSHMPDTYHGKTHISRPRSVFNCSHISVSAKRIQDSGREYYRARICAMSHTDAIVGVCLTVFLLLRGGRAKTLVPGMSVCPNQGHPRVLLQLMRHQLTVLR